MFVKIICKNTFVYHVGSYKAQFPIYNTIRTFSEKSNDLVMRETELAL